MAAGGLDQQPLPLFLRPVLLHGVGAAAHLLLALAVAGRLVFAAGSHRGKEPAAAARGARLRWCRLAVRTTWALSVSEVFFSAYSLVSSYLDNTGGGGWGTPDAVADQADAVSRAVAWLLLAAYLQLEYRSRGEERFPRAAQALVGALPAALRPRPRRPRSGGPPVQNPRARPFVGARRRLGARGRGAARRLVAGWFSAERRATGSSASQQPLLNATSVNRCYDTVHASMFTGAGFLSILTFSWMAPLLAVGHRKTLDLDDVPDLDHGDSVAGVLPSFKANLEALTGDGSVGQKVTAFKLTKALVRTVWWHVAVTALYALIYNLATYVGPYLIDSLVQYLNGDERYASKGKLLVVTFIAAKVFECLSQRHTGSFGYSKLGFVHSPHLSPSCTRKGSLCPASLDRAGAAAR